MKNEQKGFLARRVASFGYAIQGIITFFSETVHARIHALATILVVVAGIFFKISQVEWFASFICIAMVLGAEAFNSSLEYLVDLVTQEKHPLAKKAKDVAAGAVLMVSIISAGIGAYIFLPKVLALFM